MPISTTILAKSSNRRDESEDSPEGGNENGKLGKKIGFVENAFLLFVSLAISAIQFAFSLTAFSGGWPRTSASRSPAFNFRPAP